MDNRTIPNATSPQKRTYRESSEVESILKNPNNWIGTCELSRKKKNVWILEENKSKMNWKQINYSHGLFKIFDEILANAGDNYARSIADGKQMTFILITVREDYFSITNDGSGIPMDWHQELSEYIPTLVFSNLRFGSNFDGQDTNTSGCYDVGAKLANIFSKEFSIELSDGKRSFRQRFFDNMSVSERPAFGPKMEGVDIPYTMIGLKPDFSRFQTISKLDSNMIALFRRRAYDMAACYPGLMVTFNGVDIQLRSFSQYCRMYLPDGVNMQEVNVQNGSSSWSVVLAKSMANGGNHQISFVNNVWTPKNGDHVKIVLEELSSLFTNKLGREKTVKDIQEQIHLFVIAKIDEPEFKGHEKSNLSSIPEPVRTEISRKLATEFLRHWMTAIFQDIANAIDQKGYDHSEKGTNRDKLEDAEEAGGPEWAKCTLIVVEGDSAKALVLSGLNEVGRKYYGVLALQGKMPNVSKGKKPNVSKKGEEKTNNSLKDLYYILGLRPYETNLKYGRVMIMADQDYDGSHIKGLLINFFHHYTPWVLKKEGFLSQFVTPIVKMNHLLTKQQQKYFTLPEFIQKKESLGQDFINWRIKYYKGLGTNTPDEMKEYFRRITGEYQKFFIPLQKEDTDALRIAFQSDSTGRKEWMLNAQPDSYLNHHVDRIRIQDFVNQELVHYHRANLRRSIPSIMDGLKPCQRKILFGCFKRRITEEMKVAQLAGTVAELSSYHHGESNLCQTIIRMAQDYVGSNNINLLYPGGQFGSRAAGGGDAASERYIYSGLAKITPFIFHKNDKEIVNYLDDEGQSIEPEWYLPIIPMCLVNGAQGVGSGWKSDIPPFHPMHIIENIRQRLHDENYQFQVMYPWYRGHKGKMENRDNNGSYISYGVYKIIGDTIQITELPVKIWTSAYKAELIKMKNGPEKIVKDFREYHTNTSVHFVIQCEKGKLGKLSQQEVLEKFKLTSTHTSTLNLFNAQGNIKKYQSIIEILEEFFIVRLEYYERRRVHMMEKLLEEIKKMENQLTFMDLMKRGEFDISNDWSEEELLEVLSEEFDGSLKWTHIVGEEEVDEEKLNRRNKKRTPYDYLLNLTIRDLLIRKNEFEEILENKKKDLKNMRNCEAKDLWMKDLDALKKELENEAKKDAQKKELEETYAALEAYRNSNYQSDEDVSSSLNSTNSTELNKESPRLYENSKHGKEETSTSSRRGRPKGSKNKKQKTETKNLSNSTIGQQSDSLYNSNPNKNDIETAFVIASASKFAQTPPSHHQAIYNQIRHRQGGKGLGRGDARVLSSTVFSPNQEVKPIELEEQSFVSNNNHEDKYAALQKQRDILREQYRRSPTVENQHLLDEIEAEYLQIQDF